MLNTVPENERPDPSILAEAFLDTGLNLSLAVKAPNDLGMFANPMSDRLT